MDIIRDVGLPRGRASAEWNADERRSVVDFLLLVGAYLDLDIGTMTVNEVLKAALRAIDEKRLPDAF
jgi:hypothetical protein